MATYRHDPNADLDYGFDWSATPLDGVPWLSEGEQIASSSWTVTAETGDAAEVTQHDSTHDATTTTVWISGGVAGSVYRIANHVVSSDGRADDRTHTLRCAER